MAIARGRDSLFRKGELPRFLVLSAIVLVGWPLACYYAATRGPELPPQPRPVADIPPLPPPDNAPELLGVIDKTPLSIRETPGYALLLERARTTPAQELAKVARRDVTFVELIRNPSRYRGLPIHVEGTAYQILPLDDVDATLSPNRRLYEAWVVPADGPRYPFCVTFEVPPEGLPGGKDLRERVAVDGYFFKLLAYEAGDVPRFAPMIVGKLGWRAPEGDLPHAAGGDRLGLKWWQTALLLLMTVSVIRIIWALTWPRRRPATRLSRPTLPSEIDPQDLTAWLEGKTPADDKDTPPS